MLGEEHSDTLLSINNLAATYSKQGRRKDAKELLVQVVETSRRVLGEKYPVTLTIVNSLALLSNG